MKFNIKHIVILIRPHHYVKNLFIFMPLFFAGKIINIELFVAAVIAFLAFSASASAMYILNDYQDAEKDRQHPKKKFRPLASGVISKKNSVILMAMLSIIGILIMERLSFHALIILFIYIILNMSYSFYLKHIAILDVTIIAIGFVLRLLVGSTVTETPLSMWIIIITFLLALFMALAKRRDDVLLFLSTGKKMRKVVDGYNLQFIDGAMMIMASIVIVSYILYTTSTEVLGGIQNEYLYVTSLFVILGIMRYLQLSLVENDSGSPTKIVLKDTFIQITILVWLFSFVWIIYL